MSEDKDKRIAELEHTIEDLKLSLVDRSELFSIAMDKGVLQFGDKIKILEAKLAIAREALEFECGNECAIQNPCNAREALEKIK